MEENMSSYSFSHQFYQRWTHAPDPIRTAIIQELTDITTLLQADTPFETFVFSAPDLDAHLDDLYKAHDTEQAAAKKIADKQAQYRAAAEQERLKEQQEKVKKEAKTLQDVKEAQTKQDKMATTDQVNINNKSPDSSNNPKNETDDSINDTALTKNDSPSANDVTGSKDNAANDNHSKAVSDKLNQNTVIDLSLKDIKLSAAHESLIHELEVHVDDYLSEQMAQMSENLKSWLRAEVSQQLAEHAQAVNTTAEK